MKKNGRALFVWIACGLFGLLTFINFYDYTNTEASVDLSIGRSKAVEISDDFIRSVGYDPAGYDQSIIFDGCDTSYLQNIAGIKKTNELIEDQVPCWSWAIRYSKELQKEGFYLKVRPSDGKIIDFHHLILEDSNGEEISQEDAQSIAEESFSLFGEDVGRYKLLKNSTTQRKNRADHSFTWSLDDFYIGDAKIQIAMTIHGDKVGYYSKYLRVPEDFRREFERRATSGMILTFIAYLGMFILGILAVFSLIIQYKHFRVRWKLALWISLIYVPLTILSFINQLQLMKHHYVDTMSKSVFLGMGFLTMLVGACFGSLIVFLFCSAGEALATRIRHNSFPILNGLLQKNLTKYDFFSRITIGYSLGLAGLGYVTVFYLIVMNYFDVWKPISPDYSNVLATSMPFLYPLTIAAYAAINEEFMARLFAISFLRKYGRWLWLAIVLPALVWAFAHSSYPIFPMYIRGIELTIVGIIWGIIYLKYGIETVIVAHYAYNAIVVGLPLLRSNNLYFAISGFMVISLLALPGIVYPLWLRKKVRQGSSTVVDENSQCIADEKREEKGIEDKYILLIPAIFLLLFICPYFLKVTHIMDRDTVKEYKTFYENGQIKSEGTYKNGLIEGEKVLYYESGEIKSKGVFVDGRPHGQKTTYYESGQIKTQGPFKNGKWHGKWEWYFGSGEIETESFFVDGKRSGTYKKYYEGGQLMKEGSYAEDEVEDFWKFYYKNGRLKSEGTYRKGKRQGPWKWYYESGNLKVKVGYNQGKMITKKIEYSDSL